MIIAPKAPDGYEIAPDEHTYRANIDILYDYRTGSDIGPQPNAFGKFAPKGFSWVVRGGFHGMSVDQYKKDFAGYRPIVQKKLEIPEGYEVAPDDHIIVLNEDMVFENTKQVFAIVSNFMYDKVSVQIAKTMYKSTFCRKIRTKLEDVKVFYVIQSNCDSYLPITHIKYGIFFDMSNALKRCVELNNEDTTYYIGTIKANDFVAKKECKKA